MTTASAKKRKRASRPIYGVIEKVAVLETGEERLAIVAAHPIDRRLMKERGFRRGDDVRIEIKASRNSGFHRLAHVLGNLLVDNVESFRGMTSHAALKQVQRESGVACFVEERDARPVINAVLAAAEATLGEGAAKVLSGVLPVIETIPTKEAQSMAYDSMDQSDFEQFFIGICDYIDDHYSSAMTDEVRAEYLLMTADQRRAA